MRLYLDLRAGVSVHEVIIWNKKPRHPMKAIDTLPLRLLSYEVFC